MLSGRGGNFHGRASVKIFTLLDKKTLHILIS